MITPRDAGACIYWMKYWRKKMGVREEASRLFEECESVIDKSKVGVLEATLRFVFSDPCFCQLGTVTQDDVKRVLKWLDNDRS